MKPFCYFIFTAAFRFRHLYRQAFEDGRVRFELCDRAVGATVARSHVRVERDDGLAREIIFVKQRVDDHREGVPPHRIADEDVVIAVDVDLVFDQRPHILVVLLLGVPRQRAVMRAVAVIWDDRLDLNKLCAGL